MKTGNAYEQVVSGSQVRLPETNYIYDVGEVYKETAKLYRNGKYVGTYKLNILKVI